MNRIKQLKKLRLKAASILEKQRRELVINLAKARDFSFYHYTAKDAANAFRAFGRLGVIKALDKDSH